MGAASEIFATAPVCGSRLRRIASASGGGRSRRTTARPCYEPTVLKAAAEQREQTPTVNNVAVRRCGKS
jgi:hypothetical protein